MNENVFRRLNILLLILILLEDNLLIIINGKIIHLIKVSPKKSILELLASNREKEGMFKAKWNEKSVERKANLMIKMIIKVSSIN